MHSRILGFLLVLLCTCVPAAAFADGTPAIQRLRFRPGSELTLAAGFLPLDPYTKGVTASLGYVLHLSDHLAWRVVEAGYSLGLPSDLRRDLEHSFAVAEKAFVEPKVLLTSDLVLQPLYGRESFLNRGAVWTATCVSLGGGAVLMREGTDHLPYPAAAVGLGMKLFLAEDWALRLEVRDLLVVRELGWPDQVLWLSLAASWAASSR